MAAALLDAQARHLGWPLWRLLGAAPPAPVAVAARIVLDGSLESEVATADRLLREGSTSALVVDCSGDPVSLIPLLEHVRGQHGAELPVRIDFGGAFPESTVLELATAAAAFWPEAVIDPSSTLAGAARLRERLVAPVALRRTVPGPVELATALRLDAVDIWQADMDAIGGPEAFRKGAAVARAFNLDIGLAATGSTEIGAALALHLAATTPLATGGVELHPRLLDPRGLLAGGLRVEAGRAAVPQEPGLGAELDPMKVTAARIDHARVVLAP
jgi:L-alanine-DL-glutamate epimerase-like enolase superfamily enzyme